jgi:2-hydroxychromene-2-carboxylate isomerase
MARGGFGSPTMFVNDASLFFGNDRLVLVEEELRRERKRG